MSKLHSRHAAERKFKAAELDDILAGKVERPAMTLKEQLALVSRANVHARRRRRAR